MRSYSEMGRVRKLLSEGVTGRAASTSAGVPYSTVLRWRSGQTAAFGSAPRPAPWRPDDPPVYAYLFGLYLGDGHIYVAGAGRALLRVHLDAKYPGIVDACAEAMAAVSRRRVQRLLPRPTMYTVQCQWKGWTDAFPQHARGRKHERPIVLEPWQQTIVDEHPEQFVRGLVHSDGCRTVNRFTTTLPSGRVAEYAYPRYFFSNLSPDIRQLFRDACSRLGVKTTLSNHRNVSVADRRSVAVLDGFVGEKR